MAASYELLDGTEVVGTVADVMRLLDAHDPLENDLQRAMNDQETFDEFTLWKPECWWCPDTGTLITSTGLDNYNESIGDRLLYRMVMEFNEGRRTWAIEQARRAYQDNDKRRANSAKAYEKYVTKANTAGAIGQFAKLFKARREVSASELNQRSDVLGTPFGVVDLNDGQLCSETLDDYSARQWRVTRRTRANVESRFTSAMRIDSRWDDFIHEIMLGNQEMCDFLQRALGYSILGGNPEECMFIAYGATTRNGKGTLLNTISHVLGDYAAAMPPTFLLASRNAQGGTDDALASLAGVRFVTTSEPRKGARLDESKVKSLTGNDPVTTSRKYGRTFTYMPEFTMWLSCNRLPAVGDGTVFDSGRIYVIPFERHFSADERDVHLKERFLTEDGMHTVLEWLTEGCLMYLEQGLNPPAKVVTATSAYTEVSDSSLARFIAQACDVSVDVRVENNEFKDAYSDWCTENDESKLRLKDMKEELEGMGIFKKRSNGHDFWVGISVQKGLEKAALESDCECEKSSGVSRKIPI